MDSLEPAGLLLVEFTEGLKTRGNAVVKSRSKAVSCSSRRFSTAALSSRGSSVLSNRRQRQISFRTHLISLNLSSIEVITDTVNVGIESTKRTRQHRVVAPSAFMPMELRLCDWSPLLGGCGERFDVFKTVIHRYRLTLGVRPEFAADCCGFSALRSYELRNSCAPQGRSACSHMQTRSSSSRLET